MCSSHPPLKERLHYDGGVRQEFLLVGQGSVYVTYAEHCNHLCARQSDRLSPLHGQAGHRGRGGSHLLLHLRRQD